MSWVSTEKFKTVCEAIKNYVIEQANDAYNKAVNKMTGEYLPLTGGELSGSLTVNDYVHANTLRAKYYEGYAELKINPDEPIAEFRTTTEEYSFADSNNEPIPVYVGEPSKDKHAATKKYVDDSIAAVDHTTFLKKTGDTMTGTLDMGENSITNVAEPVNEGDASNKKYVDDAIADATGQLPDTYVKKSGDTMTGELIMDASENEANIIQVKATDSQMSTLSKYGLDVNYDELYAMYNNYCEIGEIEDNSKEKIEIFPYQLHSELDENEVNVKDTKLLVDRVNYKLKYYNDIITERFMSWSHRLAGDYYSNIFALTNDHDFAFLTEYQDGVHRGGEGNEYLARLMCGMPTLEYHATNKKYVDEALTNKVDTSAEMTNDELATITALFA